MLIDTHCHLTHQRYADDWRSVLQRAHQAGVEEVISIASDLPDAGRIRDLMLAVAGLSGGQPTGSRASEADSGTISSSEGVNRDPSAPGKIADTSLASQPALLATLHRTAGVHPHQAAEAPEDLRDRLLEAQATEPTPLAVGECGLDYHYDLSPRRQQRRVFQVHLEVASEVQRPVVVHCREAERDMEAFVREAGAAGVQGVLHCYPGDLELLEVAMEEGWCVSFTGLVTFSSYQGEEAVRRVPADRYMLETDGPYMAPVPHRGKRNEPSWVPRIRDRVAELRGEAPERVESDTTRTARRFFGLGA